MNRLDPEPDEEAYTARPTEKGGAYPDDDPSVDPSDLPRRMLSGTEAEKLQSFDRTELLEGAAAYPSDTVEPIQDAESPAETALELMKNGAALTPDATLADMVDAMISYETPALAVVDPGGDRLIGMVRFIDLLKAIRPLI